MAAIILILPPHLEQVSTSMLNTRAKSRAQFRFFFFSSSCFGSMMFWSGCILLGRTWVYQQNRRRFIQPGGRQGMNIILKMTSLNRTSRWISTILISRQTKNSSCNGFVYSKSSKTPSVNQRHAAILKNQWNTLPKTHSNHTILTTMKANLDVRLERFGLCKRPEMNENWAKLPLHPLF